MHARRARRSARATGRGLAHWMRFGGSPESQAHVPMFILHIALQGCLKSPPISYGVTPDTGGHIKFLLDEVDALSERTDVTRQIIVTRRFEDEGLGSIYAQEEEIYDAKTEIIRLSGKTSDYISKEKMWTEHEHLTAALFDVLESLETLPDLIHAHYADAGVLAAEVQKKFGVPFVFSGHSLGRMKEKIVGREAVACLDFDERVKAEEVAIRNADCVITSSMDEATHQLSLYDSYKSRKTRVVPAGSSFEPQPLDRLPPCSQRIHEQLEDFLKRPEKPMILAIARPVKRKNLRDLVHAYGKNPELQEMANLVIFAGVRTSVSDMEGEQQQVMRELLELIDHYNLYGKCALPKHHEEVDVRAIYSMAARSGGVFVNPALHEPFGLTVIEAAACGLPVVVTSFGGPGEIVERYGHGVALDPTDSVTMGGEILNIISDEERWNEFSRQGLQAARELGWNKFAEDFVTIAQSLIEDQEVMPTNRERIICCDIDNTLTGCKQSLKKLSVWLKDRPNYNFVISTGRKVSEAVRILKDWKSPLPQYLITSVGTEIYKVGRSLDDLSLDIYWKKKLEQDWSFLLMSRALEGIPGLELQPDEDQRPLKVGYLIPSGDGRIVTQVRKALERADLQANVIFSHGEYLDIIPKVSSKGHALRYMSDLASIPISSCIAAGDSGNDLEMLEVAGVGIVVANKTNELDLLTGRDNVYFSRAKFAAGVLEGLEESEGLIA